MEIIALLSLLGLVYLLFQGWFWRLLAVLALLGLFIGGLVALFSGNIGPGLGMLVLAWLITQVFGA